MSILEFIIIIIIIIIIFEPLDLPYIPRTNAFGTASFHDADTRDRGLQPVHR